MFIVFEGIDGTGKTTQINKLKKIYKNNQDYIFTREPGATKVGLQIRKILLDNKNKIDSNTEALLFMADRVDHIKNVILPAIQNNKIVISDRYYFSTLAYQNNHYSQKLISLFELPIPDLIFYFTIDNKTLESRYNGKNDRIESKDIYYKQSVILKYEDMFKNDFNVIYIDSTKSIKDITNDIIHHINYYLFKSKHMANL